MSLDCLRLVTCRSSQKWEDQLFRVKMLRCERSNTFKTRDCITVASFLDETIPPVLHA